MSSASAAAAAAYEVKEELAHFVDLNQGFWILVDELREWLHHTHERYPELFVYALAAYSLLLAYLLLRFLCPGRRRLERPPSQYNK